MSRQSSVVERPEECLRPHKGVSKWGAEQQANQKRSGIGQRWVRQPLLFNCWDDLQAPRGIQITSEKDKGGEGCGVRLKLRSSISAALTSGKIGRVLNDLTISSPAYSAPTGKVPQSNKLPYQRDQVQSLLIPKQWFQFPARPQNYSNEPITSSYGSQEALYPLDTTKPASQAPSCSLWSQVQILCGPAWHAMFYSPQL